MVVVVVVEVVVVVVAAAAATAATTTAVLPRVEIFLEVFNQGESRKSRRWLNVIYWSSGQ